MRIRRASTRSGTRTAVAATAIAPAYTDVAKSQNCATPSAPRTRES